MTRFAVLSDIHSNVWAVDAVLDDARNQQVDRLINLGDILYGPLAPKATYERLQCENIITIQGNQDRQIYQATEADIAANPTLQFILEDLGAEPLLWMRELPPVLALKEDIFLCHGTPDNDLVYLLEDVSNGHACVRAEPDIRAQVSAVNASLILCGHTHIPRAVHLSTGQRVVNPGSVGLPAYHDDLPVPHAMESCSPDASYCIVEKTSAGWRTAFVKVPYDYEAARQAATARGRDDCAFALTTGRAT